MTITDPDGSAVEDISRDICVRAVEAFMDGWKQPNPHAWDKLLATDVELHQPLMPDGIGVDHWRREFARLQRFLPDIRGEVIDWAPMSDGVVIHLRCHATAGGRPLTFDALDRLRLSVDGTVARRDSFFDPTPLVVALLTRPRAWRAWWLSGMAPLKARRAILPGSNRSRRRVLALALGSSRIVLGLAVFGYPQLVTRSLGAVAPARPDVQFAALAFAARDVSIGVATLSRYPIVGKTGLRMGLFADAADTIAILRARRGGLPRAAAIPLAAATAVLAAAGVVASTAE
jgi:hypothetical protein